MASNTQFTDNSDQVKAELARKVALALEAMGMQGETDAKKNLTDFPRVDTGRLRNSVAHAVVDSENAVYIGSNTDYAPYVEYGTGKYADNGKGRQSPWYYVDDKGVGHWTAGMKPSHFLRDAVAQHQDDYKKIAEAELKD